jgi:squalene-hopene/tetraprenyl-beta-curcumene cyclase
LDDEASREAAGRGANWVAQTTRQGLSFPSSPIGLYFAKLWYYEKLYPIILVAEALERLERREGVGPARTVPATSSKGWRR